MSKRVSLYSPAGLFWLLLVVSVIIFLVSIIVGFAWWWALAPFALVIGLATLAWVLLSLISPFTG